MTVFTVYIQFIQYSIFNKILTNKQNLFLIAVYVISINWRKLLLHILFHDHYSLVTALFQNDLEKMPIYFMVMKIILNKQFITEAQRIRPKLNCIMLKTGPVRMDVYVSSIMVHWSVNQGH